MISADSPKFHTPKMADGNSAMVTMSIILPEVILERMCGEDDTFNLFSLTLVHLFLSFLDVYKRQASRSSGKRSMVHRSFRLIRSEGLPSFTL